MSDATEASEASEAAAEIYSLLIPLHQARLLVPRSCVSEVIGFSRPSHTTGAPDWFLGRVDWNGRLLPIVSFEGAAGLEAPGTEGRLRVVIFHAISQALRPGYYGIVTQGFPQLVRVNESVLRPEDEDEWSPDSPVLCRIRMINEHPLVPDLQRLEAMISAVELP